MFGRREGSYSSVFRGAVLVLGLLNSIPATMGGGQELPGQVARFLKSGPLAGPGVGIHARFLDTGEELAAHQADLPLIPASTMKLLTTACGLEKLGPAYRFRTRFLGERLPAADGRLQGALYVRGAGNPDWKPGELIEAVRGLLAAGIRRIDGDLVADDTLFEAPGYPASWPTSLQPSPANAPQGALALAWNSTEVVVTSSGAPGDKAGVTLSPLPGALPLVNQARIGPSTTITAGLGTTPQGNPAVVVSGTIRAGDPPFRTWINLAHPTWAVLNALVSELQRAGIVLGGTPRLGKVPEGAVVLLEQESPPLASLVAEINKPSNNFGAEVLLRALAAAAGKKPATIAAGTAETFNCLRQWKVPTAGLSIVDGSGYGRENRMTARALVEVLSAAFRQPGWGPELLVSLPRGGEDGSLRRRFHDLPRRVRAKTGTLNGVAALAGYAYTRTGRPLAFAILLNRQAGEEGAGHHWTDRLARALLAAAETPPRPVKR